jgi:hypothetical protein
MTSSRSEHTGALLRHFADLRDGSHGAATSRQEKERLFAEAIALLDREPPSSSLDRRLTVPLHARRVGF